VVKRRCLKSDNEERRPREHVESVTDWSHWTDFQTLQTTKFHNQKFMQGFLQLKKWKSKNIFIYVYYISKYKNIKICRWKGL